MCGFTKQRDNSLSVLQVLIQVSRGNGLVDYFDSFPSHLFAVTSLSDSEAAFEQRLKKAQGLSNFSAHSFAVGTPQSPPTEEACKEFAGGVNNGTDPSITLLAFMKRLDFEACATVMGN